MKLTEEFYIQANKTVLRALLRGEVSFPAMVKEREFKTHKKTQGVCLVCKSKYEQNNLIQKYCRDCALQVQRQRYFRKKEEKIEKAKAEKASVQVAGNKSQTACRAGKRPNRGSRYGREDREN